MKNQTSYNPRDSKIEMFELIPTAELNKEHRPIWWRQTSWNVAWVEINMVHTLFLNMRELVWSVENYCGPH